MQKTYAIMLVSTRSDATLLLFVNANSKAEAMRHQVTPDIFLSWMKVLWCSAID